MVKLIFSIFLAIHSFNFLSQNEIINSLELKNEKWRHDIFGMGYQGFILTAFDVENKIPSIEIRKYDTTFNCNYNKTFNLPKKTNGTSFSLDSAGNTFYVIRKNSNKIWLNKLNLENFENEILEFELNLVTDFKNEFVINDFLVFPYFEGTNFVLGNYNLKTKEENVKKLELGFTINSIDKVFKVGDLTNYFILVNDKTIIEINQNIEVQSVKHIFKNEEEIKIINLDATIDPEGSILFSGTFGKNKRNNGDGYFVSKYTGAENKLLKFDEEKIKYLVGEKIKFGYFSKCYFYNDHFYFLLENYEKVTYGHGKESRTVKVFTKTFLLKSNLNEKLTVANVYQYESGTQMIDDKLIYNITSDKLNPIIYFTTSTQFFANNSISAEENDFKVSKFYTDEKYIGKYSSYFESQLLFDNVFLVYHKHKIDKNYGHYFSFVKVY